MTDEPADWELEAIDVDYDRMFRERVAEFPVANAKLADPRQAQEAFDRYARIMTELGAADSDWAKMVWAEGARGNPDLDANEVSLLLMHRMASYDFP